MEDRGVQEAPAKGEARGHAGTPGAMAAPAENRWAGLKAWVCSVRQLEWLPGESPGECKLNWTELCGERCLDGCYTERVCVI